jgi:hypothetical protein
MQDLHREPAVRSGVRGEEDLATGPFRERPYEPIASYENRARPDLGRGRRQLDDFWMFQATNARYLERSRKLGIAIFVG